MNWINVNDELPEGGELVLALSTTKLKNLYVYNISLLEDFEDDEVTHWMPLPKPPEEKEEG